MTDVADYRSRAQLHRPTEPHFIARAVRMLRDQGLTVGDIGVVLRVRREAIEAYLLQGEEQKGRNPRVVRVT